MSQPIPDQSAAQPGSNDSAQPGADAQTFTGGGGTGAGDSAQPAPDVQQPQPAAPQPAAEVMQPQPDPGKPLGDAAPKLADLQNEACPNCHTGVLYVTRYDPEALHEQNQGTALLTGHESGGAYDVYCAYCEFTESRAFNPGPQYGRGA